MKRRVIKRIIAVAAVMALSTVAAGCGSSAGSKEATEAAPASTTEAASEEAGQEASGQTYKVGIVQYVDDASLNQIEKAIEAELDAKGAELGVTFDYADYTSNGQADATVLNQIAADLVADQVDIIIPIATPTALIMQTATEENQIPVVFSAVSDPVNAGLVESLDAPGANITGTSDALNTEAVMNLITTVNPDIKKIGLLYNNSEDASTTPIADAKAYCDANGIEYVEKTGTNNDEVIQAADSLVADKVEAVFTPTDNTIMTAELSIYEKFIDAGIPHYCGADSFALNGAFLGYGVNYEELGTATADMAADILVNGTDPASTAVKMLDNGIATVNSETAEALSLDYSGLSDKCEEVKEVTTAENFE